MAAAGACGIKVFLGPTTGDIEAPGWGALRALSPNGRPRADRPSTVKSRRHQRGSCDARTPRSGGVPNSAPTPSSFWGAFATDGVIRLAQETGARVHIAHVALKEAVEAIARAKQAKTPITAETCPQYLFLCDEDYARLVPR